MESHLEELFIWLQDGNWQVARPVASFLASIGLAVVPHGRKILQGNDDIWIMWVLNSVVDIEDLAVAVALQDEIERIATHPTQGEVIEGAQEVAQAIIEKLN